MIDINPVEWRHFFVMGGSCLDHGGDNAQRYIIKPFGGVAVAFKVSAAPSYSLVNLPKLKSKQFLPKSIWPIKCSVFVSCSAWVDKSCFILLSLGNWLLSQSHLSNPYLAWCIFS